jgi:hypothetical protein
MLRPVSLLALVAAALAPAAAHAADKRATHVYVYADGRPYSDTPMAIGGQLTPDDQQALAYCRTGGTMTFRDNGVELATLPVDMYCSASVRPTLTPGDHVVTVEFSGNDQYLASTGSLALGVQNRPVPSLPGAPTTTPAAPAPAPVPDPVAVPDPAPVAAPAPVETPAPVTTQDVRAGLAALTDVAYSGAKVTFAQTFAAPGTVRWTLSRGDGSAALGSATAAVAAGSATGTFRLTATGRRWLRAHPHRKLLLRSVLTLVDGRAVGLSQRLTLPRA